MSLIALALAADSLTMASLDSRGCHSQECKRVFRAALACKDLKGVHYIKSINVICFDTKFDLEMRSASQIAEIFPKKNVTVVAKSSGGSISSAMQMVAHLEKFNYNIIVSDICASACGQFLFLGANKKFIIGRGAVGIHGGPINSEVIKGMNLSDQDKQNLIKEQYMFRSFYSIRGINMKLVTDPPVHARDLLSKGQVVFWIPSEKDFDSNGVKNVKYFDAAFRSPNG